MMTEQDIHRILDDARTREQFEVLRWRTWERVGQRERRASAASFLLWVAGAIVAGIAVLEVFLWR